MVTTSPRRRRALATETIAGHVADREARQRRRAVAGVHQGDQRRPAQSIALEMTRPGWRATTVSICVWSRAASAAEMMRARAGSATCASELPECMCWPTCRSQLPAPSRSKRWSLPLKHDLDRPDPVDRCRQQQPCQALDAAVAHRALGFRRDEPPGHVGRHFPLRPDVARHEVERRLADEPDILRRARRIERAEIRNDHGSSVFPSETR